MLARVGVIAAAIEPHDPVRGEAGVLVSRIFVNQRCPARPKADGVFHGATRVAVRSRLSALIFPSPAHGSTQ
jgi:hypothetical protein